MAKSAASKAKKSDPTVVVEKLDGVMRLRLNRPEALNALSNQLIAELGAALDKAEADASIGAIIITGSEKAFAAGADIKEMRDKTFASAYLEDFITNGWEAVSRCRKPIIAAVSGFALGGGNEVAMMCDIILADETAKFGQPEITLGIIPGAGGTQRLTRAVGKAKAMDLILTGRMMSATEAEASGLVSRIVEADKLQETALKAAQKIAGFSRPAVLMAKEAVNAAFNTTLQTGIQQERRLFHATFATQDQKEGMDAFIEKRPAKFKNQ